MNSGIYQVRNLVNGKIYIGSAVSLNSRKSSHFTSLEKQKHRNDHLQKSFNKHGKENFVFEVLFTCSKEDLIRLEQYHINNYKPNYNISPTAGSQMGFKFSEESKRKMSESRKGAIQSDEIRNKISNANKGRPAANRKPVYQLTLDGQIVREHNSIMAAALFMGLSVRSINYCIKGLSKSSGGFIWKIKEKINNGTT